MKPASSPCAALRAAAGRCPHPTARSQSKIPARLAAGRSATARHRSSPRASPCRACRPLLHEPDEQSWIRLILGCRSGTRSDGRWRCTEAPQRLPDPLGKESVMPLIAVIRASGRTGSAVISALTHTGDEVIAVSRTAPTEASVAHRPTDVLDHRAVSRALTGVDAVVVALGISREPAVRPPARGSPDLVSGAFCRDPPRHPRDGGAGSPSTGGPVQLRRGGLLCRLCPCR